MKKTGLFASAVIFAIMGVSCHNGGKGSISTADSSNTAKTDSGTVSMSTDETMFMVRAASGGLAEVKLGQLAREKAQNRRVKAFARMMEQDHSQANEQLKSLAMSKNVSLPDSLGEDSKDALQKLSKMQGADFDKAYMKMMVDGHRKTVDEFEKEADNGKNSLLKSWVVSTLPTLRMHLDSAKAINQIFEDNRRYRATPQDIPAN